MFEQLSSNVFRQIRDSLSEQERIDLVRDLSVNLMVREKVILPGDAMPEPVIEPGQTVMTTDGPMSTLLVTDEELSTLQKILEAAA